MTEIMDLVINSKGVADEIYESSLPQFPEGLEFSGCPRCGEQALITTEEALNALSRRDNKTYICSRCGVEEAMFDYFLHQAIMVSEAKQEAREIEQMWLKK